MLVKKYQQLFNKEINLIFLLFFLSVLIRIPIILIYGDTSLDHEWKHLVGNLIENGRLVYESFDGILLPNLWMPPLYAYYLYIFSFIGLSNENYIFLILLSQVFFASVSVIIFYKINKSFFSKKVSFYSSLLFSLIPLHLYACGQISSITLQIFSYIFFIYLFFKISDKKNSSIIAFSILSGLILLLRSEFQAIFILSILYLLIFFKLSLKKVLLILLITTITISPYLIRNFLIFEKITIAKTFGYNLWKGNHPHAMKNSLVEGSEKFDKNLIEKQAKRLEGFIILESIPRDLNYRLSFDRFFLQQAINNIKKEPKEYFIFFLKKAVSFILIDIKSSDPDYYKPLHYLPVLILGITSLIGMMISNKRSYKLNYLILIFFSLVGIFSVVSILPRYKLIILPIQIIFTNIVLEKIFRKNFSKTA